MADQDIRSQFRALEKKLRDPFRMRLVVAGVAVVVGYIGIYSPLDSRIEGVKRRLREEEQRSRLADDVALLRTHLETFERRLQKGSDANEWVQYVLQGVRRNPLKLINLDLDEERKLGPYRAIAMRLHVTGEMEHVDELLQWLESNERLFRIDSWSLEPARGRVDHRALQLTLLALKA